VVDSISEMGSNTELLKIAAYLHDIGRRSGAKGHEKRSADLAREKLPQWGYTEQEAEYVAKAIEDTELFVKPQSKMGEVLSDADTHNFGLPFEQFKRISLQVKQEEDPQASKEEWWESVINLMESHSYHGPGRRRYQSQKQRNLEKLREEFQ
jgi:predicted metal-dependent HD superfamily phosphohydrolase